MTWIKLTHSTGADYINLAQIYRIIQSTTLELTFYDANSILPISFTFSSADELTATLKKLESLVNLIDIESLANQGN